MYFLFHVVIIALSIIFSHLSPGHLKPTPSREHKEKRVDGLTDKWMDGQTGLE
jgi:hypothetical protein